MSYCYFVNAENREKGAEAHHVHSGRAQVSDNAAHRVLRLTVAKGRSDG